MMDMEKGNTISQKKTGKGGQLGEQMKDTLYFRPSVLYGCPAP